MLRLLTILSGTLMVSDCKDMTNYHDGSGNSISGNLYGYYAIGTYTVTYCVTDQEDFYPTVYHELGHLFRFMYMKQIGSAVLESEIYAEMFAYCYMDDVCKVELKRDIRKLVGKPLVRRHKKV